MLKRLIFILLLITIFITFNSCSSDDDDDIEIVVDDNDGGDDEENDEENDDDEESDDEESDDDDTDTGTTATNGCLNVVIFNNFAYGACGGEIEVVNLNTLERNLLNISADDITIDISTGQLFTQRGTTVQVLNLDNPMEPNVVASISTNFSAFSGLSAANGVLVVSAGAGGSNTQIYNYTLDSITLVTNGIPTVDNVTGNPDVNVIPTSNGAKAFYSQDIGEVANWAIQVVEFDVNGQVIGDIPATIVITPRPFRGPFGPPIGPANFPIESEFLDNQLYVASFAARGVEVINLDNNDISLISLNYEPINIGTDGTLLFVIGLTESRVDIIDPAMGAVTDTIDASLTQPTGVAANATHIIVADRTEGLVVITR